MSGPYRLAWRREAAAKGREERFITEYVRATQPVLYAEAIEFHNKLRKKYPNKMDLRRVPEVSQLKPKKTCPSVKDNLELRIPLLTLPQHTTSTVPSTTSTVPSTTSTVPSTTSTVSSTAPDQFGESEIPWLDEITVNQIIEDLQKEPELNTFFDNLDFSNLDFPNLDFPNLGIPDVSPLEEELSLIK